VIYEINSHIGILFCLEGGHCRTEQGLPSDFKVIKAWLQFRGPIPVPADVKKEEPVLKNPELNKLNNYVNNPGQNFWDSFPKNHDLTVKSSVNIDMLESEIKNAQEYMTISEKRRAQRTVLYLKKRCPIIPKRATSGMFC
jgi:hypothetical protein